VGRSRSRRTRRRIPRYSCRDIHTALIHQCIHPRVPTCQTKLRLSDWQVLPRLQDHQSNWNLAFRSAAPFDRRRKARKRPAEMTIAIPSLGFCSERPEPMLCPGGGGTSPRSFLAHLGSPPNQVPEVTALPRRDAFPSVSVALFDVLVRVASSPGLTMDVPGEIVERPAHKLYRPTFWPARSFVHLRDRHSDVGLAAFLGGPAAVASDGAGALEWIALRYAPRETALHLLPILAHPASGTEPHEGQLDYALWFTAGGDARSNRLPHHVRRALRAAQFGSSEPDLDDLANSVMLVDRDDVQVTALKPAFQGDAVVVRLASFATAAVEVRLSCPAVPSERPPCAMRASASFATSKYAATA